MTWRRTKLIMWKEILQLRRDPLLLRLTFVMPILQLLLFGYVVGSDVRNLPTAIVDLDHTELSQQLANSFSASGYFVLAEHPSSESELTPLIDGGRAQVGIVIPAGMSDSIDKGQTVPIGIVVDGADSKTASVASSYAAQIIAEFNRRQLGLAAKEARGPSLDSRVRVMFNPSLKAVNAMIPGLIGAILLISMGAIMSQAVVRERARGTLEQMLVTPITRGEYLVGKVLPYVAVATVQSAFVAVVGRYWFRVPFNGAVITVVVGLGLFMLTSIGIGLLVSLVSKTQQQAQQTIMFIILPTMVLSGFIFPIESMPPAVVPLTYLIPLSYALVVMRGAFLKGASIADLSTPLLAMVAFAIVIFGVAVTRFSKRLSE
jgi:ABC-type multidrug transport system permease subunit